MQVQLNTTTPNINHKANFSKKAQVYIDNGFKDLEKRSSQKLYKYYYKRCTTFAKDIVEQIKNMKSNLLIDINDEGNQFVCKEYAAQSDMIKENNNILRSWDVPKHIVNPFLEVLMVLKNSCALGNPTSYANKYDTEKYNQLGKLLDFGSIDWVTRKMKTKYTPLQSSYVEAHDSNGKCISISTRGRY